MSAGETIRRLRTARGMTLEELARAVGTTLQNIHKYEQGIVTNIPLEKIEKIAAALETDPSEIVGWKKKNDDAEERAEYRAIVDRIRNQPGMHALFRIASNASREDLLTYVRMLEVLQQRDIDRRDET